MDGGSRLRLERREDGWFLAGSEADSFPLVNEYLGHLADWNYSPRSIRAYGFDLLAFCRWLAAERIALGDVTTDAMLRYLAACREARSPNRPGPNVVSIGGQRLDRYAATTVNHRLASIAGLYAFWRMRDPSAPNPVPRGREARHASAGERTGMLAHLARPKRRSALRLREPRRLPKGLDRGQVGDLLGSLRTWRDRAIAGLMVFCGLRSCEVLALDVADVDIGGRWLRVIGKGAKERRVPLDVDVAGVIQTHLLAERPQTSCPRLFIVAKGPNRGRPLTPAGLRTIFRYHREKAGVPGGHPHALRHTWATALVNAGVSLQALMALLGHVSAQMSRRYGRLFDATVRTEYERALDLAKSQIGPLPAGRPTLPLADPAAGDWKETPTIKARLAGGFCLRAPAQGACPYANICEHCPSFRTDPTYLPVLAAQRLDAEALARDAQNRGWIEEADRHRRLLARLDTLITQTQAG